MAHQLLPLLALLAISACNAPSTSWFATQDKPAPAPQRVEADLPFSPRLTPDVASAVTMRGGPRVIDLAVLHVRVPARVRETLEKVWDHLQEDVIDADSHLQVLRNGIRIGVGHSQEWDAIKSIIDGIEGCQVNNAEPVSMPERFPLDLELDRAPRNQTIFCIERDGILNGTTLEESRNVLRVVYTPDLRGVDRINLRIIPGVKQEMNGFSWVKTDTGLAQLPRHSGRAYDAVSFSVTLDAGEFLAIAPSRQAEIVGIIGRAFLTEQGEGGQFESLIFLKPAGAHAKQSG